MRRNASGTRLQVPSIGFFVTRYWAQSTASIASPNSLKASIYPKRAEVELDGVERLCPELAFAGLNGDQHPLLADESEDLERVEVRIDEPRVRDVLLRVTGQLARAIEHARARRKHLANP